MLLCGRAHSQPGAEGFLKYLHSPESAGFVIAEHVEFGTRTIRLFYQKAGWGALLEKTDEIIKFHAGRKRYKSSTVQEKSRLQRWKI